jgi:formylglycine-generating enzyme required for sulfatase activity
VAARLQALAWRAFLDPEASREGASFAARELEDLPRHLFVEDLDGRWRFGHRSLWDALVAREIGPRLAAGQGAGPDALTGLHLSGAMRAFLAGEFPGWSRDDAWTLVPRGNFVSGGSRSSDERPLVIRHLPAPVRVARRAVSNAEFSTFLDETGPRPPWIGLLASWRGGPCPDSLRHHPVHDLRPEDCDAYARWAGARLPTPDEWEKAARGWDGRNFPWGDEPDPARCHAAEGLPDATVPVATHDQGSGLFDIVGNAFECTSGYYRDRMDRGRVVMGGSYAHAMMRASLRLSHTLSGHLRVGLRTAT